MSRSALEESRRNEPHAERSAVFISNRLLRPTEMRIQQNITTPPFDLALQVNPEETEE